MGSESLTLILLIFLLIILSSLWYLGSIRKKKKNASDSFVKGLLNIIEGNRQEAMKNLKDAALEDSNNINAYLLLGDLLREEKQYDKALQVHKMLTARQGLSKYWETRILASLTLDYRSMKEHKTALKLLEKGLTIDGDNILLLELAIEESEQLEKWNKASEFLLRIEKITNKPEKMLRALYKISEGKEIEEKEGGHKARIIYKDALKIDENVVSAYISIGDSYAKESRYDDAIEWYKKVIENFTDKSYLISERLEKAYFEKGEFEKVIELYLKILKNEPENKDIAFALANIYLKMGKFNDAIKVIEPLFATDRIDAGINLIYLYKQMGNVNKTNEIIDEIFEIHNSIKKSFICDKCGFKANEELIRCPECKGWGSFKKVR